MYQVSQQFRQALSSGAIHHIRGTITLANEETIALSDDNIKRPTFSQQCTSDPDSFGIGQLYTGTVELTLLGADELQRETLRGGTVTLEFGLEGHDEWVPLGIWNITDPQRGSENSIMIKGVDNTSKLDVEIPVFVGHVKMTDRIRMIKKLTGLEFAQTAEELSALAGADITSNDVFGTSYCPTCRAEVCAIAQFIGGVAFIDRVGRIAFRRFGDNAEEYTIPAARRFGADLSEYSYQVTAISCTDEDGVTTVTDEVPGGDANTRACIPLNGYPYLWQEDEQARKGALSRIRDNLASAGVWIPGSIDYAGDPTIDLGDRVYLTGGVTGEDQTAFIVTGQTWQFRGPQTLISAGAGESVGSYNSGGGSAGGGGSSTTIIEDSLNFVKMRGLPKDIVTEPLTVAEAAFRAAVPTVLHISVSAVVEGSESSVTSLSVYLDDTELDMFSEDTVYDGELRTIHFEQMYPTGKGEHTLTVKAVGLGSVRRITGSVWGKKISADISMIRTWGEASVFKWSDILLLKWGDINGTND